MIMRRKINEQRLSPTQKYLKLYKEISSVLRTARTNAEVGKGFDESNLRYMRLFYQTFKNCDTLRHELSWSHYRMLLRVKDETASNWYMNEAANQTWSTRQLDRLLIEEYMKRERNKLEYRYPDGESYIDVKDRLSQILMKIVGCRDSVLIVGHVV